METNGVSCCKKLCNAQVNGKDQPDSSSDRDAGGLDVSDWSRNIGRSLYEIGRLLIKMVLLLSLIN